MSSSQLPNPDQEVIELPQPTTTGGMPLLDAISKRRSVRDYKTDPIPMQELSNILWVAAGYNRPQSGVGIEVEGCGSAPNAHNWQEIQVYVLTEHGVHLYNPEGHHLKKVHGNDIRIFTGNLIQPFPATVPVSLIYVTDFTRMEDSDDWDRTVFPWANSGVCVENVYLYCTSAGLATVCRAMFDRPALTKALGIGKHQMISLQQCIGYES